MNKNTIILLLLSLCVRTAIAQADGWQLVWSDEFDTPGAPDPTKWVAERGFVRNHELQWYQADNAFVRNGLLVIEAMPVDLPNPDYEPGSTDWRKNRERITFTSTCLETHGLHAFKYGRFEVRARIPVASGAWPAIWTVGVENPWPSNGEIDIMEYYPKQGVPHIHANAAWGSNTPNVANWDSQAVPFSHWTDRDPMWADKFHVWRMDWDSTAIRLYLDDELLNEIDLSKTTNGTANAQGQTPFRQPHYLRLNLAIGATGGTPDPDAFPMKYEVDYVRVYQRAPSTR